MDDALRLRWLTEAHDRLARSGLRAGAARTSVIEALARDGQCLLTPAEIVEGLRQEGTASAASVYRVIDELLALGLLRAFPGRDGVNRYEIADPDHQHHHFVDERTGRVEPFDDEELERAVAAAARRLGITLTTHEVVLRGRRGASPGRDDERPGDDGGPVAS